MAVPALDTGGDSTELSFEAIQQLDAVRLFVDRAKLARPAFALTRQNCAAVTAIVRRLDGIPLAIELAAARVRMLPVEKILSRLADRFALLTTGGRLAEPRQQTLRAAIDWSHDLLSPEEQVLLRRLSVFAGPFSLDAAETVAGGQWPVAGSDGSDISGPISDAKDAPGGTKAPTTRQSLAADHWPLTTALGLLHRLVDKSLVAVLDDEGEERYRLLETIREYCREKLASSGEVDLVSRRHWNWVRDLIESARGEFAGPNRAVWLDRLASQHDNIRAALTWSVRGIADAGLSLSLIDAFWRFWAVRGHWSEGLRWVDQSLALPGEASDAARARVLRAAGDLAYGLGEFERARGFVHESVAMFRALGDLRGAAHSLQRLGDIEQCLGSHERAIGLCEESLEISRSLGDDFGVALATQGLGVMAMDHGDYQVARRRFEESLDISSRLSYERGIGAALHNLGEIAQRTGDLDLADQLLNECLVSARRAGDSRMIAYTVQILGSVANSRCDFAAARRNLLEAMNMHHALGDKGGTALVLECLATTEIGEGQPLRAVTLLGAASRIRGAIGLELPPAERQHVEAALGAARMLLDAGEADRAHERGQSLDLAEAIRFASGASAGDAEHSP
jgi:predicted ATPase